MDSREKEENTTKSRIHTKKNYYLEHERLKHEDEEAEFLNFASWPQCNHDDNAADYRGEGNL